MYGPSEWSQPRHDAAHTGWAPTETIITPANAGQVHQEWDAPPANPAIADGTLYRVGPLPADPDLPSLSAGSIVDGSVAWSVPLDPVSCGNGTPRGHPHLRGGDLLQHGPGLSAAPATTPCCGTPPTPTPAPTSPAAW